MSKFKSGIIVAGHPLAAKAGIGILKNGGNAVDAAVATAQSLGVVAPAFNGIGGGGFALVWLAQERKAVFVDYRERAPHAATSDMFRMTRSGKVFRDENSVGYKAVAVPGTVAGHSLMLEKYGTMQLPQVLAPAITQARSGFPIASALSSTWRMVESKLKRYANSRRIYLKRGRAYAKGDRLTLIELAKSLTTLASHGPSAFYGGPLGRKICEDVSKNGGLLSTTDLEQFTPTIREPVRGKYRGYDVLSAPPPSSGGAIILQALNILEGYPLNTYGHNSTRSLHITAEALARGFVNARAYVADPDFAQIPTNWLISKECAKLLAGEISLDRASFPIAPIPLPSKPGSSTTHLIAVDKEGNIVSMTESIECYFGSGVVASDTGVLLNDTMHDFDPRPDKLNSVAPWKIPVSSMSPTIIMKDNRPVMVVGSAGGPRIVSSTLQAILNVLDFNMPVEQAVAAPRLHVTQNQILLESAVSRQSAGGLREMGHHVSFKVPAEYKNQALYFGGVHAATMTEQAEWVGAADPRRDGTAVGLS